MKHVTPMNDELRFYTLDTDLRAGFFGIVYAATAISFDRVTRGSARLEYFFLVTRGAPRLWLQSGEVPFGKLGGTDEEWDAQRVHDEGRRQLLLKLYELQRERASELKKPELAELRLELKTLEAPPLVGAALRGEWTDEIRALAAHARTPVLKRYCEAAMRMDPKYVAPAPGKDL